MSVSSQAAGAKSVVDTGPLLCFGAVQNGTRLAWRHLNPMISPDAVFGELKAIGNGSDKLARAANVWLGRRGEGLKKASLTPSQATVAGQIHRQLRGMSRKVRPTTGSNRGEAECIALAVGTTAQFATNDFDASEVAKARSVPVVTVAQLLRRDFDSDVKDSGEVMGLVRRMRDAGCDIGENISGPLDLRRPRRRS